MPEKESLSSIAGDITRRGFLAIGGAGALALLTRDRIQSIIASER